MAIVACRNNFWVAVTERGGLLVRGGNEDGQLGIGSQVAALRPRALGGTGPIAGDGAAELEGGMEALALLADDAPEAPAAALAHPFESKVAMVATGDEHTMCVTDDGAVWAWGLNASGALGITHTQTPQQLAQNDHLRRSLVPLRWGSELCNGVSARMVACGDYHTLVLTRAGEVWACGRGREGQTGNPHLPDIVHSPERVAGLPAAVQLVAAGTEFSGAVDADGQVWMWGCSSNNRLGFDQDMPGWHEISAPTGLGLAAFGGEKVVHLSLGYFQSAAVTSTGALWVWGNNDFGQLGLGDFEDCSIPTLVAAGGAPAWGGSCMLMAACGWYHKLVLTKDGCVWSCGQGEFGLLGPGDESDVTVPVRIRPRGLWRRQDCLCGRRPLSRVCRHRGGTAVLLRHRQCFTRPNQSGNTDPRRGEPRAGPAHRAELQHPALARPRLLHGHACTPRRGGGAQRARQGWGRRRAGARRAPRRGPRAHGRGPPAPARGARAPGLSAPRSSAPVYKRAGRTACTQQHGNSSVPG